MSCAIALLLLWTPARAQEDGRPLPPSDVQAQLAPASPPKLPAERASQRGLVILTVGGGIAAAFVVLTLSGVFKPRRK